MSDDPVLRSIARELILAGRLPATPPERTWAGPGARAECMVCGRCIGTDEVEFELEFASSDATNCASCHAHLRCYDAWEEEVHRVALPTLGTAGTLRQSDDLASERGRSG